LLGKHDGARPPNGFREGLIVERGTGIIKDNVENDGRGAAAMEGIDEVCVLDARPPVGVGRKPKRFGGGAVDGDDEDVGRRRASATEPEQEAEPD
jgi:hypothetical protein